MKSPQKAISPTLLRILLHSGFWTKCGAPHFVPLLLGARKRQGRAAAEGWENRLRGTLIKSFLAGTPPNLATGHSTLAILSIGRGDAYLATLDSLQCGQSVRRFMRWLLDLLRA